MSDILIKNAVRAKFNLTSRDQASLQIRKATDKYLELAQTLNPTAGALVVNVPAMTGVDEDMRDWSFFMLLEHNVIVNRRMSEMVRSLSLGEEVIEAKPFNPKTDVMPGENPGAEQIAAFRKSVDDHLDLVESLGSLRGTAVRKHPIFGEFDAHKWHCMLGFHLMIHFKQAKLIANAAIKASG